MSSNKREYQNNQRFLESVYRKQNSFSRVRDYYRTELAAALLARANLPLTDDTNLFNDWLSLRQESTMAHLKYDEERSIFLRVCKEFLT